jgi:hypothetical protein
MGTLRFKTPVQSCAAPAVVCQDVNLQQSAWLNINGAFSAHFDGTLQSLNESVYQNGAGTNTKCVVLQDYSLSSIKPSAIVVRIQQQQSQAGEASFVETWH